MLAASIEREQISARYQSFAQLEASQRSPLYSAITRAIAADPRMIEFLAALPNEKRQPNLLLGVVRYLFGTPSAPADFIDLVLAHRDVVKAEIARRSTQTNEPARCATLLPALAQLPQPLALLAVGAAAGLCLLPDRYGYDYGKVRVAPSFPHDADTPVFRCRAAPATPLPGQNISVVWRAGLDLAPVDLRDESQVRWLEALVWPGRSTGFRYCGPLARSLAPTHRGWSRETFALIFRSSRPRRREMPRWSSSTPLCWRMSPIQSSGCSSREECRASMRSGSPTRARR